MPFFYLNISIKKNYLQHITDVIDFAVRLKEIQREACVGIWEVI
jgi:hypothetical protein